jgi:TM2 domain-containing membrane protein YozV
VATNCPNCGAAIVPGWDRCMKCGTIVQQPTSPLQTAPVQQHQQQYQQVPPRGPQYPPQVQSAPKQKVVAILLALFLGALGIHNFYLGYTAKGLWQLLITVLSLGYLAIIPAIWALIELIMIAAGAISTDAKGNPLV